MSARLMPSPPSATGRLGVVSFAGKSSVAPAFCKLVVNASGPTRSSTITAGMLSDMRSASRALIEPWNAPSKSLGA